MLDEARKGASWKDDSLFQDAGKLQAQLCKVKIQQRCTADATGMGESRDRFSCARCRNSKDAQLMPQRWDTAETGSAVQIACAAKMHSCRDGDRVSVSASISKKWKNRKTEEMRKGRG